MRRGQSVIAIAAVATAVAGCGSHAVTRAQVIARADAICANTLGAVRVSQAGRGHVAAVVPLIGREVRLLVALPRPAAEPGLLDRYLAAMRASLAQWRTLAAAQLRGSSAAAGAALAALSDSPAPELAARYGMRECAAAGATVGSGVGTPSP